MPQVVDSWFVFFSLVIFPLVQGQVGAPMHRGTAVNITLYSILKCNGCGGLVCLQALPHVMPRCHDFDCASSAHTGDVRRVIRSAGNLCLWHRL